MEIESRGHLIWNDGVTSVTRSRRIPRSLVCFDKRYRHSDVIERAIVLEEKVLSLNIRMEFRWDMSRGSLEI